MTTKKNNIKALLFALAGAFLLTGCDPIEAVPANYEEKVIEADDIYENMMGILYDATSSNKKDDVLSRFMDIVAEDQFGKYSELKEVATNGDDAALDAFVSKHAAYKHTNTIGEVEEDQFLADKYGKSVEEIRRQRVKNFLAAVNEEINKSFYNDITSKSFSDDTGKFFEKRLAYDYYGSFFDIDLSKTAWKEGYPTKDLKKEDVSEFISFDGRYDDYIERRLVPSIYKDKLVENYLLGSQYATLGRAYGRKVNMIKLTRDEKFKELPDKLLNKFATEYIHGNQDVDFEVVANAWKGFRGVDENGDPVEFVNDETDPGYKSYKLLIDCGYTFVTKDMDGDAATTDDIYHYFAETQYGQLMEKYSKIDQENRFPSEEAQEALNEFTNSLAYTKEKGLKIKLAELATTDYTTDGWYVKNGGLTELPSEIRDRLFNIKTARGVDSIAPEDAEHPYDSDNYVRNINGHYYLTPKTSETGDDNNFVIYNDGSFFLIEVQEAVSTSKLDLDGKESYVTMHTGADEFLFTEGVARKLADALGTKDTYVNKAYSELIKGYSLKYHDNDIYDYFKEKYPELFEDED